MKIKIESRRILVNEYQQIRETTGWDMHEDNVVEKALRNDLYSVCIYADHKLIGIGRVVGDGYIYFYIQDIIVTPYYQGKGIGKIIMDFIEEYLSRTTNNNSFIGLMAAADAHSFYTKYGYIVRPENSPGMYKRVKR